MSEPSLLDYLKAILSPWRGPVPVVPAQPRAKSQLAARQKARPRPQRRQAAGQVPWRSVSAFACLLIAQYLWSPPRNAWHLGVPLGLVAIGLTLAGVQRAEWRLPKFTEVKPEAGKLVFRRTPLVLALIFFVITFLFSSGNQLSFINTASWFLSITFTILAFWQFNPRSKPVDELMMFIREREWKINVTRWGILVLFVFAVIAVFRFSDLSTAPLEMTSDHAEKLLDVTDVINGKGHIYFERNTGREALQFYLSAWISKLTGTEPSFLILKLGTSILAFISLIYIYLLGKEIGGRWVGLFALFLVGVAYWPNLLARTGLRFSLYPTFAAPTLLYLLRGLKRGSLNDFLLAGLFMGIGLHGYTAFRAVPIVALAALGIFWLHHAPPSLKRRVLIGFAVMALLTLVILAPLVRYALERPEMFGMRMFSRVLESEREYPAPVWQILPMNILRGLTMFNVSGGNIWLVGLIRRPAFDIISAALLIAGVALSVIRYARFRKWEDLFLLISIPLLMLPSTLALAFPEENPAMNRASGAWIPAFLLCAIALDALLHGLRDRFGGEFGLRVAQIGGALILLLTAALNYKLFFHDYVSEYDLYAWNTSELGAVIADYARSFGNLESVWVVAYPHWVDTRLVAANAGALGRDFGIWPDGLSNTLDTAPPKLFLVKPDDTLGLETLRQLYPEGLLSQHESRVPGKEFLVYLVSEQ